MTTQLIRQDDQANPYSVALADLQGRLRGELLLPGSEGYDQGRKIQDDSFDKFPTLIVRAADDIDVLAAVRFAREHGLPLAVRSGGHSVAGQSTVDDGMVIDLSLMKALSIDPVRQVAWVQPGLTWGDHAQQAQAYGLATSSGDAASVGVGGLTIGGGIGWMVRKYGLTIDHLISVDVVTADGQLLRASAEEHPDLFWAIRGGGGNFGVVTAFELRLEQVGMVVGGAVFYPLTEAQEVISGALRYAGQAPDELTTMLFIMTAPPAPFIPAEFVGQPVAAVAVCYTGDLAEGERVVAPLRSLGTPIADVIGPMPYPAMYALTEDATRRGFRHAVRSMYLDAIDDEVIDTIVEHSRAMTPPFALAQIRVLGGAMARVGADETAFAHRTKPFLFMTTAVAEDAAGAVQQKAWVESFYQAMRPHAAGVYVNFLGNEGESRVREAYSPATLERLAAVKRRYDPTNFFRLNQNIAPAK